MHSHHRARCGTVGAWRSTDAGTAGLQEARERLMHIKDFADRLHTELGAAFISQAFLHELHTFA